ncbi:MAG: hypothetical protein GEV08_06145 [Acidimicrobiia bacterium]|nr:hypothetical protein [Acidimicrobiia bacterium]
MAEPIRPCPRCGGHLAWDNAGPLCSPCWRSGLRRSASRALRAAGERGQVAAAFVEGGVPAVAEALLCPLGEALDLVLLQGLVPSSYRRRYRVLLRLLALGPVPHTVAADLLGLSRWTVATYRQVLGVALPAPTDRPGAHRAGCEASSPRAPSEPPHHQALDLKEI